MVKMRVWDVSIYNVSWIQTPVCHPTLPCWNLHKCDIVTVSLHRRVWHISTYTNKSIEHQNKNVMTNPNSNIYALFANNHTSIIINSSSLMISVISPALTYDWHTIQMNCRWLWSLNRCDKIVLKCVVLH